MTHPTPAAHCLDIFFADMRHGHSPVLYQKQEEGFRDVTKKEAADIIHALALSLQALGVAPLARVAIFGAPSPELWLAEWGTFLSRAIAVIVPSGFTREELVETLAESKSRVAIVDRLSMAHTLADAAARLPDLKHIICFQGGAQSALPILAWKECIAPAQKLSAPGEMLRAVKATESAALFYYKDADGVRQAALYTHALLLRHARTIDATLGYDIARQDTAIPVKYRYRGGWRQAVSYGQVQSRLDYIRSLDSVLAAVPWEDVVGHLAAYVVPVLKEAAVQVAPSRDDIKLTGYRPHVIIGDGAYLNGVCKDIIAQLRQANAMLWQLYLTATDLGKIEYEAIRKLGLVQTFLRGFVRMTIARKVHKMLGERLRLAISVDDAATYETKILFYTFGIDFVELPPHLLGQNPQDQ